DAPFLAAWMWALAFGYRAVMGQSRWAWPMAGLCVLFGILAKHTMILWVMSFALFLLATPTMRGHLRRPGFWIMATLGLIGCVPILAWNAMHGWATIWHTQIHVGVEDELAFHPFGPRDYLGGQFAILLGFWFIAWARAIWRHRPARETKPDIG